MELKQTRDWIWEPILKDTDLQGLAFSLCSEIPTHSAGFVHKENEKKSLENQGGWKRRSVKKYRRGCRRAVNSRGRGCWKEKDHAMYSKGGTTGAGLIWWVLSSALILKRSRGNPLIITAKELERYSAYTEFQSSPDEFKLERVSKRCNMVLAKWKTFKKNNDNYQ